MHANKKLVISEYKYKMLTSFQVHDFSLGFVRKTGFVVRRYTKL